MKKIILCPHMDRDAGLKMTNTAKRLLSEAGYDVVICPLSDKGGADIPKSAGFSDLNAELEGAEMLITLGGDGTMLRAARASAGKNVPLLGLNMGSRGFMAELETEDIQTLPQLLNGRYTLERRVMLDVSLKRGGKEIYSDFSLNDIVVRGYSKVVDIGVFGDNERITHFYGDGVIIATPTGSTAYSMASGGPIVEPTADNVIVTPICAHVLAAKAFVLAPERIVDIRLGGNKDNPAYLSVDGGACIDLHAGDVLTVKRSEKITWLVHTDAMSFYKRVYEKLGDRE